MGRVASSYLTTWIAAASGILAASLAPVAIGADEVDETLRWAPALSVSFDVVGQKARAQASNGPVLGPPLPEGCDGAGGQLCPRSNFDSSRDTQIRPDSAASDTMVAPLVGASVELMTPRLFERASRPRLFVRGDVAVSFGFESKLAGETEPGPFAIPSIIQPGGRVPENLVLGQGSRAVAQLERHGFSGGAGVAFTTALAGRTVRIRPSFEYVRERLELKGSVHRAVALSEDAASLAQFRFIELADDRIVTYHGYGGGLEIEADSWHAGPIRSAVFVGARFVHFSGDRETTLHDTNEFGETASWRFEKEAWAWRGGAGIRFRWAPE